MNEAPEYEIARFLRQLRWLAVVSVALWLPPKPLPERTKASRSAFCTSEMGSVPVV